MDLDQELDNLSLTLTLVKLVKDAGRVNMEEAMMRGGTWSPLPSGTVMTPSVWLVRVSMTSVFIRLLGGCSHNGGCDRDCGGHVTEDI